MDFPLQAGRAYYLHLIQGELALAGLTLQPGDGLKIAAMDQLQGLATKGPVLALWFDLPG